MGEIKVERNPTPERLNELGVEDWPIWSKEVSEFPWSYAERERCYFLQGEVTVTPAGGVPVTMGEGDFVTFPEGMSCTWTIRRAVKKHYDLG